MSKVVEHKSIGLNQEISHLVGLFIFQALTSSEVERLTKLIGESQDNMKFFEIATDIKTLREGLELLHNYLNTEKSLERVKKRLVFTDHEQPDQVAVEMIGFRPIEMKAIQITKARKDICF